MVAKPGYRILDLTPYRHLFPAARMVDITIKKGADVSDTVAFMPRVIEHTRWQVKRFVETELSGLTPYEALAKLWFFVKCHVPYKKDKRGKEQVKSSRRVIGDALIGVGSDCDDMTSIVGACATWIKGVKRLLFRITKYGGPGFSHIYPVVVLADGSKVIMDCVWDAFNDEKVYTEKEDHNMDLEYLDGIDQDDLGALKLFGKEISVKNVVQNVTNAVQTAAQKTGEAIKTAATAIKESAGDVLHAVNIVNPATVLLRNGLLAAMKINMMNVAGRLKWAYLTDDAAAKRGADKPKLDKLRGVMNKLEDIFHGAGGDPKNLRASILEGKGNADKSVSGIEHYSVYTPLAELLGPEMYYSEAGGMAGLGQLGEVVTATAITAASGAIATIAALIKGIGNLFPKGAQGAADFDAGDSENPTSPETPSALQVISNITNAVSTIKEIVPTVTNLVKKPTPASPAAPAPPIAPVAPSATLQTYEAQLKPQPLPVVPTATVPNNVIKLSDTFAPGTKIIEKAFVQPAITPPQVQTDPVPKSTTNTNNTGDPTEKKKKAWVVPTLIAGGAVLAIGIGVLAYRSSQKRKSAITDKSTAATLKGIDQELEYVLVEECEQSPAARKKTERKPNVQGKQKEEYVLVEESEQSPTARKKPETIAQGKAKEEYVLVEENKQLPDARRNAAPKAKEEYVLVEEQQEANELLSPVALM